MIPTFEMYDQLRQISQATATLLSDNEGLDILLGSHLYYVDEDSRKIREALETLHHLLPDARQLRKRVIHAAIDAGEWDAAIVHSHVLKQEEEPF